MDEDDAERLLRDYYGEQVRRATARRWSPRGAGAESGRARAPIQRAPRREESPWPSLLAAAAACALIAGGAFLSRERAVPPPLPGLSTLMESAGDGSTLERFWEALRPAAESAM